MKVIVNPEQVRSKEEELQNQADQVRQKILHMQARLDATYAIWECATADAILGKFKSACGDAEEIANHIRAFAMAMENSMLNYESHTENSERIVKTVNDLFV